MNEERRRDNRRVALMVIAGMFLVGAIATAYALATIDWRRKSDTMRPDMPSFLNSLLVSLAIFFVAAGIVALLVRRFNK